MCYVCYRSLRAATFPAYLRTLTAMETTSQYDIWAMLLRLRVFVKPPHLLEFLYYRFIEGWNKTREQVAPKSSSCDARTGRNAGTTRPSSSTVNGIMDQFEGILALSEEDDDDDEDDEWTGDGILCGSLARDALKTQGRGQKGDDNSPDGATGSLPSPRDRSKTSSCKDDQLDTGFILQVGTLCCLPIGVLIRF